MLIFKDIITSDEVLSDAYDLNLVDNVVYEVNCQMIQVKPGADVDIGANPSAEDAGEELEDGVETVNNIVNSFRLQSTGFDKKSYLTHLKAYMKVIKAKLADQPEEQKAFEKGASVYAKKIIKNFKDFDFYTTESMNPDGMVILLNYREDGTTPYVIVWKHGLVSEKI
ncbi:Tma19p [Ascoidea rubescens DSM 1968]|uniref:Translationally-controlled tumor protein homolog n=1 Tax=Ascoidea rubescens DSM 1968 TaxID=1344418 RepID=A0A1D2VND9_9ASCO|nr:translationally controlled tumor protein [Ascoidea rubescens DSM 1968]ODV63128.1 translationally controlled tumor protein [Ascoidea rubescens DSM 1968]